jgi:hypothetical protein
MKKFNTLREDSLEEKLKASDPAGKYIHDFVHSDNPKFAGKSKAKRIQMALAASYAAKGKSRNEEVEPVDEGMMNDVSRSVGKMVRTVAKKASKALTGGTDQDQLDALHKRMGLPPKAKNTMKESEVSEEFWDDEGGMIISQLKGVVAKSNAIIMKLEEDTQLEAWVQSKITTAEDSINSVHDYLMYSKDATE